MEQITIQTAVPAQTPPQQFVDSASLKTYAQATTVLTVVVNLILFVYNAVRDGKIMPNKLLIPIAILLSVLYVLSFFKKDPSNTLAQYCWITALNSIMLFTSISGVNSMLYSARQSFDMKNQNPIKEASVADFFVDLIFPTHSWFGTKKIVLSPAKEEVVSISNSLVTTKEFIDTLLSQKKNDSATIGQLQLQVDSLQTNYILTLDVFSKVQKSIVQLQDSLKQTNVNYTASSLVAQMAPKIEADKNILVRQQRVQKVQQVQQQEQQLQQVQELKTKQWQIQEQQQQIQNIQTKQFSKAQLKLN